MLSDLDVSRLAKGAAKSKVAKDRRDLAAEVRDARVAARIALDFLENFQRHVLMGAECRWVDRPVLALRLLLPESARLKRASKRDAAAARKLRATWARVDRP